MQTVNTKKRKGHLQPIIRSTSFVDFARAASSEHTGMAWDDPEEYRFTIEISSMKEEVLPD